MNCILRMRILPNACTVAVGTQVHADDQNLLLLDYLFERDEVLARACDQCQRIANERHHAVQQAADLVSQSLSS